MMKSRDVNLDNLYDLPCHVCFKDNKGIYRESNNYLPIIGGPSADDLIGSDDDDLLIPVSSAAIKNNDQQVLTTQAPLTIVENANFLTEKNFNNLVVLSFKQPLYGHTKKILGVMGLSFIIDFSQSAQEILEKFPLPIDHTKVQQAKQILNHKNLQAKDSLTKRQADCLYHLVQGKTAKQIAHMLNLSFRTVEHHLVSLKNKFNCTSRSELISLALNMDCIKRMLNLI